MKSFIGLSVIAMTNVALAQIGYNEWNLLAEVNEVRAQGLTCPNGEVFPPNPVPLQWDCNLYKAAQLHSQDMADNDYFSHTSQDGRSPWERANAQGVSAHAENIAAGSSNPVPRWAASPGHCTNMMNPNMKVMVVGFARNYQSSYRDYWTQMLSYNEPSADTSCYLNPTPKPTQQPIMPTQEPTSYPTFSEDESMSQLELDLYYRINDARVNGITCNDGTEKMPVDNLQWSCGLWKAAHTHTKDMATNNFFSHTGSDGSSHYDRAKRFGADDYSCSGFNLWGKDTAEEAWTSIKQLLCNHYFMDEKYNSIGIGYAYDADSDRKHYWTMMMGRNDVTEDQKACYAGVGMTDVPTPVPTVFVPTHDPTPEPTSPTFEPTPYPTYDESYRMVPEEMELFDLINEARVNGITCNGGTVKPAVQALEWNCGLWKASHYHANDMATNNFYGHTGTDGASHYDRSKRFGYDDRACTGMNLRGMSSAASAWATYKQMMCTYFFMEPKYNSIGIGYRYDATSSSKHYWTIMLGYAPPTDELKTCLEPVEPTQPATPIPTAEPTMPPTDAPTATPTPAPTDAPTNAPTNLPTDAPTNAPTNSPTAGPTDPTPTDPPTDPTDAPVACKNNDSKSDCKKNNECAWKGSKCSDKSKICPKQSKMKKCAKYNCNWIDGACAW